MINVLDHGYVRFIESWGHGDAGQEDLGEISAQLVPTDYECGIIEAARQSTQASFRGWEDSDCPRCGYPTYNRTYDDCCPDGEKHERERGDARLLAYLFNGKPQHASPFEFAGMVIEVQAPIFVFREWHRHRTQSYNEMSARYAPLPDLNYVPTVERCLRDGGKNKQAGAVEGADELTEAGAKEFQDLLKVDYEVAETHYQSWLKSGVPKELARLVLPVGRYSRMRASANLRNWLAFMTLRADSMAQWEIQQYAHAVGQILAEKFPRTWELYARKAI